MIKLFFLHDIEKNAEKLWHAMSGAAYVEHVFNIDESGSRYSISENNGENLWGAFVKILKENNLSANLLFEFLKDTSFEGLSKEADIVTKIINA